MKLGWKANGMKEPLAEGKPDFWELLTSCPWALNFIPKVSGFPWGRGAVEILAEKQGIVRTDPHVHYDPLYRMFNDLPYLCIPHWQRS